MLKGNIPISPVTQKADTKIVDSIAVIDIINLYQKRFRVDVSKYFKGLSKVEVAECSATGYRFYYPFEIAGNGTFYEELQKAMAGDDSYYRPWGYDHEYAREKINKDEHVLDIGCGSGNFLKKIREKTDKVYGLEFNNKAIEDCKKEGLTVFAETIEHHSERYAGFYDVVCAFQVLEHVYKINEFITATVKVLRKGGRLIIGVPNNEPYFQRFNKYSTLNLPPHHMGLWNRKAFEKIQEQFHIKLKEVNYVGKDKWLVDAYFRAKYWFNIKSIIHQHTLGEKIKMLLAAPVTVPLSLLKKLTSGINGGYIVVLFEKLD